MKDLIKFHFSGQPPFLESFPENFGRFSLVSLQFVAAVFFLNAASIDAGEPERYQVNPQQPCSLCTTRSLNIATAETIQKDRLTLDTLSLTLAI